MSGRSSRGASSADRGSESAAWGRPLVTLAAALLVAGVTTSGKVWVTPSRAVLGVAAALVVIALLSPAKLIAGASLSGALVVGAAAGHILWSDGMPRVHDLDHVWGIWAYGRCIADGAYLPRWVPYLGAGMPLFQFYGPLNFLLALPGIFSGLDPMAAWKLEMAAGHVLSALSMFWAARLLGAGWRGAMLAATAAAFSPWRLAVFDYRGALGEANAFVFMPLAAAAALRMLRRPSPRTGVLLAASVVGLVLTHLQSIFTLGVALIPAAVACEAASAERGWRSRWRRLRGLAAPLVVAGALSAAWWLPAVAESRLTSVRQRVEQSHYFRYEEHGVSPPALLERRAWDRLRISLPESLRASRGLESEQMPFYAGAVLVLAGLAAPFWSRRSATAGLSAGALLALALATPPAAKLLAGVPGFAQLYFPFRFLTPASVLSCLAVAIAASAFVEGSARGGRRLLPPIVAVLLVWDAAPFTGAADWIRPYSGTVHLYTDERNPAHWQTSMKAVPVVLPSGGGNTRVWDLVLPPSSYTTPIASFYSYYGEWITPAIYRTYWWADNPSTAGQAGVRLIFKADRPEPERLNDRPYASLETPGGKRFPVAANRVRGRPGRIEAEVEMPPGGGRLVVLEQNFPGWTARIDRTSARAPAESGGFMAVDLPEGVHRVELIYGSATTPRVAGLAISAAALLGLGAVGAVRRKFRP